MPPQTPDDLIRALAELAPGQSASQSTQVNKTLPPSIPLPAIPARVGVAPPTLN